MRYSSPNWPVAVLLLLYIGATAMLTGGIEGTPRNNLGAAENGTRASAGGLNAASSCPVWLASHGNEEIFQRYLAQFNRILDRFDCPQPYSVKYHCSQCKEAYMAWLCSSLYKYEWIDKKNELRQIKPCRSFCHRVEQKCPFFLPLDKGPVHYAGEPTFLCLDPNIEETGEQLKSSSYGREEDCCYDLCGSGEACLQGNCGEDDIEESSLHEWTTSSSLPGCLPWPSILLYLSTTLLIRRHFI